MKILNTCKQEEDAGCARTRRGDPPLHSMTATPARPGKSARHFFFLPVIQTPIDRERGREKKKAFKDPLEASKRKEWNAGSIQQSGCLMFKGEGGGDSRRRQPPAASRQPPPLAAAATAHPITKPICKTTISPPPPPLLSAKSQPDATFHSLYTSL